MTEGSDATLLADIADYYASKLALHGPTSQGVDWNGRASHDARHRQFLRLLGAWPDASVLDLGCGFGDFYRFLRNNGHPGAFVGYDVSAEMIAAARDLHGTGHDRQWHVGASPAEPADFAVASGIFNVRGETVPDVWARHVEATVDLLAKAGRQGFGFNLLSLSSDPERRRPDLYYADPVAMLAHCLAGYGRHVALLQDYGLYEFTIVVRHEALT